MITPKILSLLTLITVPLIPAIAVADCVSQVSSNYQNDQMENSITFTCATESEYPITTAQIVEAGNQKNQPILNWLPQYFPNSDQAVSLCQNVAIKLQEYYDAGNLKELSLKVSNLGDKSVVCIQETDAQSLCTADTELFALTDTKQPNQVFNDMINGDLRQPQAKIPTRGDFPVRLSFPWLPF